jgi:exodeoxyribonuclease VII large subunit
MRGRHAGDLTHAAARVVRARLATRERRLQQLLRQLGHVDVGRRLSEIRTRLVSADGRLGGAATRRNHRADAQLRNAARRLETLSPLAVLGRGYAVCWNAERTEVVRDADRVAAGEQVLVTLARGELTCGVISKSPATEQPPESPENRKRG